MENCLEVGQCRLCESNKISIVLDLGQSPPANAFLKSEQALLPQEKYPLQVYLCENCGNVGLKHSVNSELLFKNYLYESSTSASFRKYFENFAKEVIGFCGIQTGSLVVDIGSNDFIALKPFQSLGMNVLGIEPATNIVEKYKCDIPVINDFFKPEVVAIILDGFHHPELITCTNCFAHLSDWNPFMHGLYMLMNNESYFVFENAYLLDTIKNCDVGQIYSEHTSYHSLKPLQKFFRSWGMNIVHVERTPVQMGSIRCYVKKAQNGEYIDYQAVKDVIKLEEESGIYSTEIYKGIMNRVNENGTKIKELLIKLKEYKQKIALYGWPAKFTTLGSLWDISQYIDFVIDDSVAKQGLISPLGNLRIGDKNRINEADYCILGAYNFSETIIKNNPEYRGKWISILPEVKIV